MTQNEAEATIDGNAEAPSVNGGKRKRLLTFVAIFVLAAAVLWGLWYAVFQRGRISTDNAYVGAEVAQVTPLTNAAVKEVRVVDTQLVEKGDILLILDGADAQVALAAATAQLRQAQQRYKQAAITDRTLQSRLQSRDADIMQARARVDAANAQLLRAKAALARRQGLAASGAVSTEEIGTAKADYDNARANSDLANAAWQAANADRNASREELSVNAVLTSTGTMATDPDVAAAQARLDAAQLDVDRNIVRAPVAGVITQSDVQVGQRVAAGMPVMRIVPLDKVFVEANFKEVQLRDVRVGQPVELESDYYGGGVVFHGHVVGFAGGTGAATALIPAQNASGNWVKVVQRLPVRIAIDPAELKAHPLRIGLSMDAVIDTRGK